MCSMVEKDTKKLSISFEENIAYMNEILPVKESFDVIRREIIIGGKNAVFYFIDGFMKDEAMLKIMTHFSLLQNGICRMMWMTLCRSTCRM